MARRSKQPVLGGRTGWVLFGLALWVVVIVLGAGGSGDDAYLGVSGLGAIWLILMVLMALLGLVLLIWLNPFSSEFVPPDRHRGWVWMVVAVGMIAFLLWKPELLDGLIGDSGEEDQQAQVAANGGQSSDDDVAPEVVAEAADLLLLVLVIGAAGGIFYITRARGGHGDVVVLDDVDPALEADMVVAVEQITTELLDGQDPRVAVLNAYAVLEQTLAAHGARRGRSETPTEYMKRSLRRVRVEPGPLLRLVELYEVARFSEQVITVEQQQSAARALGVVQGELKGLT